VPERDITAAIANLERLPGDRIDPLEPMFQMLR
jgi:hypothetical protein